jgi:hypothetical protein
MLSTKQKMRYLEKRVKEYTKSISKQVSPVQRMIMNSSLETISNLIATTKEEKLYEYLDMLLNYITTLTTDYETVEDLEQALDMVTSKNGY